MGRVDPPKKHGCFGNVTRRVCVSRAHLQSFDLPVTVDCINSFTTLKCHLLLFELCQSLHQPPLTLSLVALLLPEPCVFFSLLQQHVIP